MTTATRMEPGVAVPERTNAAAWGGVVFVTALVASFFTAPSWPEPNAPLADLARYATAHRSGILAGQYLTGLGLLGMVGFGAHLAGRLKRHASDELAYAMVLAIGAGVAGAALASLALTTAASRVTPEGGAAVLAPFALGNKAYPFIDFANAAIVAIAAVGALRYRMLPRWLGTVAALLVPAFLVSAAGLTVESGPLVPFGTFPTAVFMAFLAWVLATSIVLVRDKDGGRA